MTGYRRDDLWMLGQDIGEVTHKAMTECLKRKPTQTGCRRGDL